MPKNDRPRVAFHIFRQSNYRVFGPVIDQALASGWHVECWPDHGSPATMSKQYLFPSVEATPAFQHGRPVVRSFANLDELVSRLERLEVDAVVSVMEIGEATQGRVPPEHPIWTCLQAGTDTFIFDSGALGSCDLLALHSSWWLDWCVLYRARVEGASDLPALRAKIEPRCRYVGFTETESARLVDREEVRRRWGIPSGQPVVVVLPFPQGVGKTDTFWPKKIFGEPSRARRLFNVFAHLQFGYLNAAWRLANDPDIARALRAFCDRNGAFLLVKSRQKTPVPEYLRTVADRCVYDEGFYPPTIVEAMSVATLCISYYSLAVLEATALGVPHRCIVFRPEDYLGPRGKATDLAYYPTLLNRNPGGLFEFGSVSRTLSPEEAVALFSSGTFEDFHVDATAQADYLRKFLGIQDGRASARVLEAVSSLLGERV